MKEVYIVAAKRTPIGSWGGALAKFSATDLGSMAIKGALKAGKVKATQVDEVFMGNVVSANLGQAPARQAALAAGVGKGVPCTTINKVCSSGMKAIMFGAQSIMFRNGGRWFGKRWIKRCLWPDGHGGLCRCNSEKI